MSYSTPQPPIPMPDGRQQQHQHQHQQWYSPMPDARQGQASSYTPRSPHAQPGYFTPSQSFDFDQSPFPNSFATFTPESYPAPARRRPQPYARTPAMHGQPPLESPMTFPIEMECDPMVSTPFEPTGEVEIKPPPRPPNAWILYRSDRLRDIADGVTLPALDGVKAELGLSTDSGDKSPESGPDGVDGDAEVADSKAKKRKPKKGSKAPAEGILNLGKGKTGRGIPQADISKLISMMWARESDVVKKEYDALANRKKEEHAAKYPDYKFQPQRRADKMRIREERERQKQAAKKLKEDNKHLAKGPKRRMKSRPPTTSPYSSRPAIPRQSSGSGVDEVVDWNKSQFVMNPFPFQGDALPSMHSQPPPHTAPIKQPPPHELPVHYDNFGSYMPEVHVPGYGNAFAEPFVFEPLPIPGEENFSFDNLGMMPDGMPDAESLAAIWCSIEEDVPGSSTADQFNLPSGTSSAGLVDWNVSAEQAINEWSTLVPDMTDSVGQPIITDWANMAPVYDPSLAYLQVPYNAMAGPSGTQSAGQHPPGSAPLISASSHIESFDINRPNVSQGVFLSAPQPLSPVDSTWTDIPHTFGSAGASLGDVQAPQPVRYVSSSAFPDTPLSVGTAGWTERTTSYSALAPINSEFDPDHDSLFGDDTDDRLSKSGNSSADRVAITPGNYSPAWGQPVPVSARSVSGFSDYSRRGSGVSQPGSAGFKSAPHSASVPAKSHMPVPPPIQRIASTGSVPTALPSPTHTAPRSGAPSPFVEQTNAQVPVSNMPYVPPHPRGVRKGRVVGQAFDGKDSPLSTGAPFSPT